MLVAGSLLALPRCATDDGGSPTSGGGGAGRASSASGAAGAATGGASGALSSGGKAGTAGSAVTMGGAAGAASGRGGGGAGGASGAGARAGAGAGGASAASGTAGTPAAGSGGVTSEAGVGGQGPEGGAGPEYWQPRPGLTWQWQLSEEVSDILDVDVYDIDWESSASTVADLHAQGIKVICYVSVGSWEDFRPDADQFPDAVVGNDYDGWPGEKYLDIRSEQTRSLMLARFDLCRSKGFDAIEPDNMDVFELGGESGFPLTRADGVAYAKWLADAAHARGLGIGQKNASSITSDIEPLYDWALTESCYSDGNWCGDVKAYPTGDKPVFMCEYESQSFSAACSAWKAKGYSPILKDLDLGADVTSCP